MSALDTQVGGAHYKQYVIQPAEFCQRNGLHYCESAAIKYICRHASKGRQQDIAKAIHYLNILMDIEYPITGLELRKTPPRAAAPATAGRGQGR